MAHLGAWTDSRSTVGFKAFLFYFEFSLGEAQNKTPQHKPPQLSTAFEASPPSSRLGTDCFTSKLTRMSNVRVSFRIRTAEEYAPDVSLQGRI